MDLQENIHRIQSMMGVITENDYSEEHSFVEGFHGSASLIEEFNFPLFLTTSKLRAMWFATEMRWSEKLSRNVLHSLKGGEEGYLYHIRVKNPELMEWKGGPSDEILIKSGMVTILEVNKVGVKQFAGQNNLYIIEKLL
jgi:hypothetical protein